MRYRSSFKWIDGLPFFSLLVLNEELISKANMNALFSARYWSARMWVLAPAAVTIRSNTLLKNLVMNLSRLCRDLRTLSEFKKFEVFRDAVENLKDGQLLTFLLPRLAPLLA